MYYRQKLIKSLHCLLHSEKDEKFATLSGQSEDRKLGKLDKEWLNHAGFAG